MTDRVAHTVDRRRARRALLAAIARTRSQLDEMRRGHLQSRIDCFVAGLISIRELTRGLPRDEKELLQRATKAEMAKRGLVP